MAQFAEFSWRTDPTVPDFDDTGTIAFMDGECMLCMTGARLIDRLDASGQIGISPTQSPLGQSVLRHFGMSPEDPDSWLVLDRGRAYAEMEGIILLARRMDGMGHLLQVFRILPVRLRSWLYRRISRNRYALLGRRTTCELPTPELQARLIKATDHSG